MHGLDLHGRDAGISRGAPLWLRLCSDVSAVLSLFEHVSRRPDFPAVSVGHPSVGDWLCFHILGEATATGELEVQSEGLPFSFSASERALSPEVHLVQAHVHVW